MAEDTWERDVAEFWALADRDHPSATLAVIEMLVARRTEGDPQALFELASAHDFVGRTHDAMPLYQSAIIAGVDRERASRARARLAALRSPS